MDSQNPYFIRGTRGSRAACSSDGLGTGFDRFRKVTFLILVGLLVVFAAFTSHRNEKVGERYIQDNKRTVSPVNTTYYIDPVNGSDSNIGTDKNSPWHSFDKINSMVLTEGNVVKIVSAGILKRSLFLIAEGTSENPVTIDFAPGRYDFFSENAVKQRFYISNTNDAPDSLKSIAFYLRKCKNIKFLGNGAEFVFRGKVMENVIDSSENISIENLSFDYNRPTVSEMKVVKVSEKYVIAEIQKDSKYEINDYSLMWIGEGWKHRAQRLWQVFNPETGNIYRNNFPVKSLKFEAISPGMVRISFERDPGFKAGLIYQNRNTFRDYAAVFSRNSKNILWKNVNVYFMHGMGFVSQFCEDITFDNLIVAPKKGSGRTCAAWADILHFSGCKGKIEIKDSYLSAANDDAVNVHGTHLRITDIISEKKVRVRFMHPQTYGFYPFYAGDSIEFISAKTLLPYSGNVVTDIKMLNYHEFELYLKDNIPDDVKNKDVIENITWTPDVNIRNTTITRIPTRGVLVTTRGEVVIENNEFLRTHMSAILIADDANSWYESGYVKNVLIEKNRFIDCGRPVINIHPENKITVKNSFVHSNIRVTDNYFQLGSFPVVAAKSVNGLSFTGNIIEGAKDKKNDGLVSFKACSRIDLKNNKVKN